MQTFAKPATNIAHLNLTPGMKVADLGAGSGFYAVEAARRVGNGGTVFAVEIKKDLLPRIETAARKEKLTNIKAMWGDVEHSGGTKIKDNSMDALIISNILFQLEDKDGFVKEARRILKPGKEALVIGWSDSHGGLGPHSDHVVTEDDAIKLFKSGGFEIGRKVKPGAHHWGFLAKKSHA